MKVEYMTHSGDDLLVVNAARVSFGKEVKELSQKDEGLIRFLATGLQSKDKEALLERIYLEPDKNNIMHFVELLNPEKHFMPFCHPHITLRCSAPIFVVRQLMKHQIGFSWSEESLRYIESECEMYYPEFFRSRAEDKKQGSTEEPNKESEYYLNVVREQDNERIALYKAMLEDGIAAEQARTVLPLNLHVNWVWTGSLYAWARMCNLRLDAHAQKEVQEFAKLVSPILNELFPLSWKHLVKSAYYSAERK